MYSPLYYISIVNMKVDEIEHFNGTGCEHNYLIVCHSCGAGAYVVMDEVQEIAKSDDRSVCNVFYIVSNCYACVNRISKELEMSDVVTDSKAYNSKKVFTTMGKFINEYCDGMMVAILYETTDKVLSLESIIYDIVIPHQPKIKYVKKDGTVSVSGDPWMCFFGIRNPLKYATAGWNLGTFRTRL